MPSMNFVVEVLDGADALEGRHRAAQLVGLGGREFRRHDRDAHRLFLEQRHAQRLVQDGFQLVRLAVLGRGRRIDRLHAGVAEFLAALADRDAPCSPWIGPGRTIATSMTRS